MKQMQHLLHRQMDYHLLPLLQQFLHQLTMLLLVKLHLQKQVDALPEEIKEVLEEDFRAQFVSVQKVNPKHLKPEPQAPPAGPATT